MSDLATVLLAVAVVTGAAIGHAAPVWIAVGGAGVALALRRPLLLIVVLCPARFGLGGACRGRSRADARGPIRGLGHAARGSGAGSGRRQGRGPPRASSRRALGAWRGGASARVAPRWGTRRGRRCGPGRPSAELASAMPTATWSRRLAIDAIHGGPRPRAQCTAWRTGCIARSRLEPACCRGRPKGSTSASSSVTGAASTTRPTARFEAAGLTHLLAVSGENVAFVLAAAGADPSTAAAPRTRALAALVVIGFFATVTRFEPSVLRASAMAGLAAVAQASGRPASGLRLLSARDRGPRARRPVPRLVGRLPALGRRVARHLAARPAAIADRCPGPTLARRSARRHDRGAARRRARRDPRLRFDPARGAPRQPARRAGGRAADDVGLDRGTARGSSR